MTDRMTTKVASAVLLVGAVAGLTWYGTDHLQGRPAPVNVAAPVPLKAKAPDTAIRSGLLKDHRLPAQQYLVPYADAAAQKAAQLKSVQTCMARYGLTYEPPVKPGDYPPPTNDSANLERRYGLADRAAAEQWGYALPDDPGEPPQWEPGSAVLDALYGKNDKGEEVPSVNGQDLPKGGCNAEANASVGQYDESVAAEIGGESFTQSMNDPDVQNAFTSWSSCMKDKGYDYKTPFDITRGPKEDGWATSPETKKIAVAEVDCKQSTGLTDVWFNTESRIQRQLVAARQPQLDRARTHNQAVAKRSLALR